MPFQRVRRALLVAASSALLAACGGGNDVVSQLTPSRVIAFGDAFSDLGQMPGRRYTINEPNAFNWTQQVAGRYGLTLAPSSAGGLSYATGNARVSATPDAAGNAATPTIEQQVGTFLATQSLREGDLVLMNGGISDIVAQVAAVRAGTLSAAQAEANVGQAGRDLAAQVKRLVAAGARAVAVAGAYNLGRSPFATISGQGELLTALSAEFNEQLLIALLNEGRNVLYVDAALYFNLVTGTPAGYAITNIADPACTSVNPGPGIGIGAGEVDASLCTLATLRPGIDPATALFADPLNFTTKGQLLFGDYAQERIRQRF